MLQIRLKKQAQLLSSRLCIISGLACCIDLIKGLLLFDDVWDLYTDLEQVVLVQAGPS